MSSRPSRGAARLAGILDALPDALLLVNCNGTVVNANTIAIEAFEAPGTALVGRGLLDLLPDFDSKRIPGSMRRPDDTVSGRTKPTRMLARRTDGTEFPVEVTSANLDGDHAPYADPSPHPYTGDELLMLVVRDLSGTVDTEAELARQQRQTEMILRAAAEGVVGVDVDGKIVLVNPSAAQILGYRASDLGGKDLHPLIHHSRPDGTPLPYEESPLTNTLRSGRKYRVRGQALWAKDGSAVPVDLTTAPVRDGDQLVGAVMTFVDRRPFQELEARYAQLEEREAERYAELEKREAERYAELEKREAERYAGLKAREAERYQALASRHAQLLAVLGTSLRGPMERLRTELGTLASDPAGQLWPEANQILHHLAAGYSRMTTLVDNVLSFQRLDAGDERLQREAVSLDAVVTAGVEGAIELIGPGRAQFAVHAPPLRAEVDPGWLAQALAHLIADVAGVDATGNAPVVAGAWDSTIVVAAAQRGDVVRIEVRGPYAGGDPVHGPLVRGIVERHGGVLQTHEVPGTNNGHAYVLEVPLVAAEAPGEGRQTSVSETEAARGEAPGTTGDADPKGSGTSADGAAGKSEGAGALPAGAPERRNAAPVPGGRRRARSGGTEPGATTHAGSAGSGVPADVAVDRQQVTLGTGDMIAPQEIVGPQSAAASNSVAGPREGSTPQGRGLPVASSASERENPGGRPELPGAPGNGPHTGPWNGNFQEQPRPSGAPALESAETADSSGTPAVPRPTGRRRRPGPADVRPVPPGGLPQAATPAESPADATHPDEPGSGRRARRGGPGGSHGAPVTGAQDEAGADGEGSDTGVPPRGTDLEEQATGAQPPLRRARHASTPPGGTATGGHELSEQRPQLPEQATSVPPRAGTAAVEGTPAEGHGVSPAKPQAQAVPQQQAQPYEPDGTPALPAPQHPEQETAPAQPAGRRARRALAGATDRPASEQNPQAATETSGDGPPYALPPAAADQVRSVPTVPDHAEGGSGAAGDHHATTPYGPDTGRTPPEQHPAPTGRRRARQDSDEEPQAQTTTPQDTPAQGTPGKDPQSTPANGTAAYEPRPPGGGPFPARPAEAHAAAPDHATQSRAISVRTLGQGVPFTQQVMDQQRTQPPPGGPSPQPSTGSGRRRKLATPPEEGERTPPPGPLAPAVHPREAQPPQQAPRLLDTQGGRAYAIGRPDEGAEGPEPLDGPNGAVDVTDSQAAPPMDDELPPEPLDNPRRLLVWPAPDAATHQALTDRGYRPVIVHSREEVDAQIAAFPAALFVDPLTGPITRTALQSLRAAAGAADVPVLVTAGLGQATRETAYGADPALLLKALAPRDSEQHPPRVLLIEAQDTIAGALSAALERRGMQVARAISDADAVTLGAQMRPNLVVMDLMQVRRRRAGIVDWLRANGVLSRTPLVVYTAVGLDTAELPRLAAGETMLFLAERSTSAEVQERIVDLLAKIGAN